MFNYHKGTITEFGYRMPGSTKSVLEMRFENRGRHKSDLKISHTSCWERKSQGLKTLIAVWVETEANLTCKVNYWYEARLTESGDAKASKYWRYACIDTFRLEIESLRSLRRLWEKQKIAVKNEASGWSASSCSDPSTVTVSSHGDIILN